MGHGHGQVAAGTTVFGVAVRQLLSVGLAAAEPKGESVAEMVDVNAMLGGRHWGRFCGIYDDL